MKLVEKTAEPIINCMQANMSDGNVLHSVYQALYTFADKDPNCIMTFKERGLENALVTILDQKELDPKIEAETNEFLTVLVSDEKIIKALDEANEFAQELMDDKNNIGLIEDLDKRLVFLSNVCGTENKYQVVIDNGGLVLLPTVFQALNDAKDCLAREKAIQSAAQMALKLGMFFFYFLFFIFFIFV